MDREAKETIYDLLDRGHNMAEGMFQYEHPSAERFWSGLRVFDLAPPDLMDDPAVGKLLKDYLARYEDWPLHLNEAWEYVKANFAREVPEDTSIQTWGNSATRMDLQGAEYTKDFFTLVSYKGDRARVKVQLGCVVIADCAFADSRVEEVIVDDGVKVIGMGAFSCCKNLRYVHLPMNLTKLGKLAFWDCPSLCEIQLPEDIDVDLPPESKVVIKRYSEDPF